MMHNFRLNDEQLLLIENNIKDIELRLYDEKRKLISVNDDIVFEGIHSGKRILTRCTALHRGKTFLELFNKFDSNIRFGSLPKETHEQMADQMRKFYSEEQELKYGVIGIEVKYLRTL